MSRHEELMRLALEEARRAYAEGETPVGAVIARGGQVVATGRNQRETACDPTAHAELLAIREAARALGTRRLSDCVLYVTLEPCPMCAGAMVMAQLKACYFGASDARQGCCESVYALPNDPAFYHRLPCVGGVLADESAALLRRFFEERRAPAKGDTHD